MDLHPLHETYLGIGSAGSSPLAHRDLHPLHQVYLGMHQGAAGPLGSDDRSAQTRRRTGNGSVTFGRVAALVAAAAVVAQLAGKLTGGK